MLLAGGQVDELLLQRRNRPPCIRGREDLHALSERQGSVPHLRDGAYGKMLLQRFHLRRDGGAYEDELDRISLA